MIKLLHGYFENTDQSLISLNDKKPDLVIADPPDNIGMPYCGVSDKVSKAEFSEKIKKWVKLCCDLTEGPVFFIPAEQYIPEVEDAIREYGLKKIQRIIWQYSFGQNHCKRYGACFRPVYWLNSGIIYPDEIRVPSARQTKYGDKRANPKGKLPPNVWDIPRVCGTWKERRDHPAQLPEMLVRRIVLGHSRRGDLVFDPFLGSGTTAIVSDKNERHCVGIDASKKYLQNMPHYLGHDNVIMPTWHD